jgi:dienelactone hydrolase
VACFRQSPWVLSDGNDSRAILRRYAAILTYAYRFAAGNAPFYAAINICDQRGEAYDEAAAEDSWRRSIAFLRSHMKAR